MRRPLPLYSMGSMAPSYDDLLHRQQSPYRVIKSQPADPHPRLMNRAASIAESTIFHPPLSMAPRLPEPVAFLTMDLVVAKASKTFSEAIGVHIAPTMTLFEIVSGRDHGKIRQRHQEIRQEQSVREPQYLPPIFGHEQQESVIRQLAFSHEQISRFSLEIQDNLTFQAADGQQRTYMVRMGLAKQESIYFIVLVLITVPPFQAPASYPTPSSVSSRELNYSSQPSERGFSQSTPASASFDSARALYGERGGYGGNPSPGPRHAGPSGQMVSGLSPGIPPSYAPSSTKRPEYPLGPSSYQIPRSELTAATRQESNPSEFQLPPIRTQPQPSPAQVPTNPWPRDERSSRVDIGDLLKKPDTPKHS